MQHNQQQQQQQQQQRLYQPQRIYRSNLPRPSPIHQFGPGNLIENQYLVHDFEKIIRNHYQVDCYSFVPNKQAGTK